MFMSGCAGLQTFLAEEVDVAILEVGLGGRLDATNVIRAPFACGITPLGYDHMAVLGYTLPEIAGEKAGILKPGCPAFTVPQPADAMAVIEVSAVCSAILLGRTYVLGIDSAVDQWPYMP